MANPFLGEIRAFSFAFAPHGWALCNGQLLPISQNTALFSLLGITYGGNGIQTFALPNLQGRVALHFGNAFVQGQIHGEEAVALKRHKFRITHMSSMLRRTAQQMPATFQDPRSSWEAGPPTSPATPRCRSTTTLLPIWRSGPSAPSAPARRMRTGCRLWC